MESPHLKRAQGFVVFLRHFMRPTNRDLNYNSQEKPPLWCKQNWNRFSKLPLLIPNIKVNNTEWLGRNRCKHMHGRCFVTPVARHVKKQVFPIVFSRRNTEQLVADVGWGEDNRKKEKILTYDRIVLLRDSRKFRDKLGRRILTRRYYRRRRFSCVELR